MSALEQVYNALESHGGPEPAGVAPLDGLGAS
jgi:hypothetical protein